MATKTGPNNAEPINPNNVLGLAAQDFACFCVAMHPGFELARHTSLLIDRLEAIEQAQGGLSGTVRRLLNRNIRLAISEPPRHGKTQLLELYIAWYLGRHSQRSVIFATYGQDLPGEAWCRRCKSPFS